MGNLWGRNTTTVEQIDETYNLPYYFPPKSGSYFGPHFFMGGKKFDIVQPEAYLFGENTDLNLLGPRPQTFPYQASNGDQPVRALKCLLNIRKDSLRLIRVAVPQLKPEDLITNPDGSPPSADQTTEIDPVYNLEFTFDADCPCSITVYYNSTETMENKVVNFTPNCTNCHSDTVHFNAGSNQQFCLPSHIVNPAILHKHSNQDVLTKWDYSNIPIAIQVRAECGPDYADHCHIAYAVFEKVQEAWTIKLLKQKQAINGVCYLLQEIYGIENKHTSSGQDGDAGVADNDDDDDDSSECVVCLSDSRDTLILPCKHLCLCSTCANQLRFQQSGCPICRQSFRALLQIRAVRKKSGLAPLNEVQNVEDEINDDESVHSNAEDGTELPFEVQIPPGYEVVPLIDAINGQVSGSMSSLSMDGAEGVRASSSVSNLSTGSFNRRSSKKRKSKSMKVEVENEVSSLQNVDPDVVVRSNSGSTRRRRSHRKQGSMKKYSIASETQGETSTENSTSVQNETNPIVAVEINMAPPLFTPIDVDTSEQNADVPDIDDLDHGDDDAQTSTSQHMYDVDQTIESGQSSSTSSNGLLREECSSKVDSPGSFVEEGSLMQRNRGDKIAEEQV